MLFALIMFVMIGLLPFFVRELRSNGRIVLTYWFVIVLHQVVAFANTFYIGTLGATGDAERFQRESMELAQSGEFYFSSGMELYNNILGVIYWLLGPSHLLGEQFSILAFAVSCVVLIKMLRLLELSHYSVVVLLFFGALPSMVFFGSVALRESYQILFFMLAVYFGIKMYVIRDATGYFPFMVVSALLMGVFHRGLLVYAVFMIVLFMLWTPHPSSGLDIKKSKLVMVFAMLASLAFIILSIKAKFINSDILLSTASGKGLLISISEFREAFATREALATARAAYFVAPDFSSPFKIIETFFLIYAHFLFAPFPWQIKNILDVYASLESILRLVLIYCSVRHWQNAYGVKRRILGLMVILFLSMSFMWSIGTSNYGTAARHNLVAWWILSVTGVPYLMRMLSRFRLA